MTDPDTNTIDIVRGAGYTPGPWVTQEDDYFVDCVHITSAQRLEDGKAEIATVEVGYVGPFESEQQANVNLISLAPELAEHVAKIEEWAGRLVLADEAWATPDGLPRMPQELYDEWVQLQDERAALLKALRGES